MTRALSHAGRWSTPNSACPVTVRTLKANRIGRSGCPTDAYLLHNTTAPGTLGTIRIGKLLEMTKIGIAAMMPGYETDMPAYKDVLSDADIWAVLSFIESTWPADIRERQQRMNQQNP